MKAGKYPFDNLHHFSSSNICRIRASVWALILAGIFASVAPAGHAQEYTIKTLYSFTGSPDGTEPLFCTLVRDPAGNLYGTTYSGGAYNLGTVFKLSPQGVETVLHSFSGPEGATPYSGVVFDRAGNLYGATYNGGLGSVICTQGCGVVYRINAQGKLTVLHRFTGSDDGGLPIASLTLDSDGNLYGTTEIGGALRSGAVFKLDRSGNETVLYSFAGGSDGENPFGSVIRDDAGNLYGTTVEGGLYGFGTVFQLDPSGHQTILHNFGKDADGQDPRAGVYRDSSGNLYGSTFFGGVNTVGTVYKVDPSGNETVLHNFNASNGSYPESPLVADQEGNLYGTASQGGPLGIFGGTVFKVTPDGEFLPIYAFTGGSDGENPVGGLLVGGNGKLIGASAYGGVSGNGTIYTLTP